MKIEQLIIEHFYNSKQVTLQGIGSFNLSNEFAMPIDSDKDVAIPNGAITFDANLKATEDASLISYIVQQTRKIKPLASSDLESYIMLMTQFLNLGKPFKIEGIGVLDKDQYGTFHFTQQGQIINSKAEDAQVQLKEKTNEEISFTSKSKTPVANKKPFIIIASIIALAVLGTAAWFLLNRNSEQSKETIKATNNEVNQNIEKPKTSSTNVTTKDSAITNNPTSTASTIATSEYNFKIIFKETKDKEEAILKMKKLTEWGHKIIMYNKDSSTYILAEPFKLPLSDTTKIKDSLNHYYYAGKAYVSVK